VVDRLCLLWLIAVLAPIAPVRAGNPANPRVVVPLDFDWRFTQADVAGAETAGFDDSAWRKLDLPHDWGIDGVYRQDSPAGGGGAYLPGGVGWYRREIDVPAEWAGRRVRVEFDAAQRCSDVWINGHHLGNRPYGYISFSYDLTPHLEPGGKNVLAVRLNDSEQPAARWYTGAGIYAHVRLVVSDPIHVPQWGTFVTTPEVTDDHAQFRAATEVENSSGAAASVRLVSEVLDDAAKSVAKAEAIADLKPGERKTVEQAMRVEHPRRWSPDSPRLYRLVSRVYRGQELLDEATTAVGIRTVRWDAATGFWLNGKNLKIRGLCMHYDAGGACGAAIPDALLERRILALKAIGCNAIRTGHTPFPPVFYDLCDRHGMMVLDEAFDGWKKKAKFDYGALYFKEWWKRDLADFVRRDRNHPCVIAWSIGNETGRADKFGMTAMVHRLDPTRLTTGGQCLDGVDVAGFNGPGEQPVVLEDFHRQHPDRPVLLTEEPHGYQTRGFYRARTWWRDDNPRRRVPFPPYSDRAVFAREGGDRQYRSSYDNATVRVTNRQSWRRTRDTPWIAGAFRWCAFDYLGEAHTYGRHWPARYGEPGIFDSAGLPKDVAFFYQSQWTPAAGRPMVHLLSHWSHPLLERGTVIPVVAYSNCEEVELMLNGRSLGRRTPRAGLLDFVWQVPYEPGEIRAIGYRGGKPVAAARFRTAGDPGQIRLELDHAELKADRRDVATVTVRVTDDAGETVPWADDRIEFKLTGDGARLLGYENGNSTDVTPHRAPHRNVFAGLARGFFQSTGEDGPAELSAAAILGRRPFQGSVRVALRVARVPLRGSLAPAAFEIRYTLDGTEPTPASPRYETPLTLTAATTVRMLVLRDGKPWLISSSRFEPGVPEVIEDPRYETPATTRRDRGGDGATK
jgi:beta-galactosidase